MDRDDIAKTLKTLMKLGLCGATLVMVAWAIVIVDGSGSIKRTSADIIAFGDVPLSNTARFEDSLDALGHTEPRSYDLNGNEVGFSTRYTHKRPIRLLAEYQRTFVRQGLNEEMYLGLPIHKYDREDLSEKERQEKVRAEATKRQEAMMSGQIIPLDVQRDRVLMGGAMTKGHPQTRAQFREQLELDGIQTDMNEMFQGFRVIEAVRDDATGKTMVTANWSRGRFDTDKHRPDDKEGVASASREHTVPNCLGCTRTMHFGGQANATPDKINIFGSRRSPDHLARYYDEAMRERGWERTPTNQLLGQVLKHADDAPSGLRLHRYTRGQQQLTIGIQPSPGLDKTTITTYQSE